MLQCKVAVDSDQYDELRQLGWRVRTVANGQAVMVKDKARCQKPRKMVARQCGTRTEAPDEWPDCSSRAVEEGHVRLPPRRPS